jgi:hypothetical protein
MLKWGEKEIDTRPDGIYREITEGVHLPKFTHKLSQLTVEEAYDIVEVMIVHSLAWRCEVITKGNISAIAKDDLNWSDVRECGEEYVKISLPIGQRRLPA